MKKILSILLACLLFPVAAFALTQSQCNAGGGIYNSGDCTCPKNNGISQIWSAGECICVSPYTKINGICVIQTTETIFGSSSLSSAAEASRCTSAWCYPSSSYYYDSNGNKVYIVGTNKQATYDYSTGLCSCPNGYSSTTVEYFNKTVTDDKFDASSGVSGTGGGSGGSSFGTGGSSTISSNYTSGNSSSSTIALPTVTSTGILTNPITSGSFADLLNRIIDWILNIALVLAPLVIVYGGFIYMTAAGDTNKVSQGKNIVLYAVIGFIVALLAKSLIGIFTDLVVK